MAMRLWASSTVNALNLCRGNGARTTILPTFSIYRRFSSVLDGFKYNSSHEWVKHDGSVATIGITNHAQGHLGEVVFVELPESGSPVSKGGSFGAIESVKVTNDVNSPILGEVVEVNTKLTQAPGLVSGIIGSTFLPHTPSKCVPLITPILTLSIKNLAFANGFVSKSSI